MGIPATNIISRFQSILIDLQTILKCLISYFQHDPLLGIRATRLVGCHGKERCIEESRVFGKEVAILKVDLR
jgi:hypothetical protein